MTFSLILVSFSDLESLLNFMYYREVNITQENLNSFLSVAEELQVKGLTQSSTNSSNSNQTQTSTATTRSNTSSHAKPRVKPEADSEVVEVEEVQKVKTEPGGSGGEHQVVASYEGEEYQDYQETEEGYGGETEGYSQDLYSGQQAVSASGKHVCVISEMWNSEFPDCRRAGSYCPFPVH